MNKAVLVPIAGLVAAALGFTCLLYVCAIALRPDVKTPPPYPDPGDVARVEEARRLRLDPVHPPAITREVDHAEGPRGAWWPRAEAPVLASLVEEGKLPPVESRVGPEPIVMEGVDGIGRFGGTWQRLAASTDDVKTIQWRLSYASLVRWSPQGYPIVPHLAKSWQISSDFREYTFQLRRGVRWSDGHPFTAEDLAYWYRWEVQYFAAVPRPIRNAAGQGRVEKVDEFTVRFIFAMPNPLFLERLAGIGTQPDDYTTFLVPAHYLKQFHPELGDKALIARYQRELNLASPRAVYQRVKLWNNPEHPRLWPWVYRTFSPNSPYVFVRNPYYPVVDTRGNQLPYLDRLVMEVRPTNMFGLSASTGQVSMQDRFMRYEDHVLLMSEAKRNDYHVLHWYQASRSQFTIFPVLNRKVSPDKPETAWKSRLLNDRRFRQALSLAINRRDIIDALFNGQGEPAQIDPGPGTEFYSPALFKSYTAFDPARANALLDELGLKQRDREGYRTFPDGTRMVWYLNMTEFTGNEPAQFVIDDWARVGVRCIQRIRARPLFNAEKLGYEHDFTVWTSESEFMPLVEPRNFVPTYGESFFAPGYGIWYQNGGLHGTAEAKRAGAIEPPAGHPLRRNMEVLERLLQTPDPAVRHQLFRDIQDTNAEEVWTISIGTSPPQLVVVKNGFRNVPANILSGASYQSPGNGGLETYFWDNPADSAATLADTRRSLVEVRPEPAMAAAREGLPPLTEVAIAAGRATWMKDLLRLLILGSLGVGLVLVALRHPFIGRRLMLMVPTLAVVSVIVFYIVQLPPGDFVTSRIIELEMTGTQASEQQAEDYRLNFHLNEPLVTRYLRWVGILWFTTFQAQDTGLLQGNLGLSMEHNRGVNEVVGDRVVLTVVVSLATILFTWALAVPMGIYSAVRQYSLGDYVLTFLGFLGMSVPGFLLAVVLMYAGNQWFGFKVSGLFSPEFATMPGWSWAKFRDLLTHLWVPVVVLGFGGTAGMIRVMRANLLDELKKPYVTTARAKGVRPLKLLFKYPVRLALNPFISGLGGLFPQLVSGGAIVALVLSLPMIGPALLESLLAEDVYLAGSMLMVMSLLGVFGTLVSDLLLLWIDPRIRLSSR